MLNQCLVVPIKNLKHIPYTTAVPRARKCISKNQVSEPQKTRKDLIFHICVYTKFYFDGRVIWSHLNFNWHEEYSLKINPPAISRTIRKRLWITTWALEYFRAHNKCINISEYIDFGLNLPTYQWTEVPMVLHPKGLY